MIYQQPTISGSVTISGPVTASYFKGDGSALTNLNAEVSGSVEFINITNKPTFISSSAQINVNSTVGTPNTASHALTALSASYLNSDSVNYETVGPEFKVASALTPSAGIDVDCSTAQVFTLIPDQNTILNITNPRIGQTKIIVITGSGLGAGISWTVSGGAGTFNLVAGAYDDTTSTKNFIQMSCVTSTEFWYTISQIAT
jgi:hypothetical protein|tara:strand:- start:10 stop:612 length:603 start_codon:yes stop_codon:yes gene_type:complete